MKGKIKFISEDTLQDLKINYNAYKKNYHNRNEQWFDDYFGVEGKVLESSVDFDIPELNYNDDHQKGDRENVKILYKSLQHLPVNLATQERLWAGLAHLQLRDYTFHRLSDELAAHNDTRINSAIFYKQGNKRSLFIHILARLWWCGHMTYDELNKENPFWLTDFFTEKDFSARCVTFFSSDFTSNPSITKGILRAIYRFKEQGENITRDYFTQSTKYLNVVGGAIVLDVLSAEEIEYMVGNHLAKIFKLEKEVMQLN